MQLSQNNEILVYDQFNQLMISEWNSKENLVRVLLPQVSVGEIRLVGL
jgi:hypothetical protein